MGTRRRRRGGFAWFFSKQLLAFLALAFLVIVVDFFLYAFIAVWESDQHFDQGSPATLTRRVDAGLVQEAGTWTLDGEAADALDAQEAWALLVDAHGTVAWERGVPADVPRTFSINDVAVAARYGSIEDHPSFFWDRADGLLVVGFPQGSYWSMSFTYPESTMRNLPLYVLLLFGVDFLILFVYVLRSRRRTLRTVTPVTSALEDLSEGRPGGTFPQGRPARSGRADHRDLGHHPAQGPRARAVDPRGVARHPHAAHHDPRIRRRHGQRSRQPRRRARPGRPRARPGAEDQGPGAGPEQRLAAVERPAAAAGRDRLSAAASARSGGLPRERGPRREPSAGAGGGRGRGRRLRAGRRTPYRARGGERARQRAPAQRAGLLHRGAPVRGGGRRARAAEEGALRLLPLPARRRRHGRRDAGRCGAGRRRPDAEGAGRRTERLGRRLRVRRWRGRHPRRSWRRSRRAWRAPAWTARRKRMREATAWGSCWWTASRVRTGARCPSPRAPQGALRCVWSCRSTEAVPRSRTAAPAAVREPPPPKRACKAAELSRFHATLDGSGSKKGTMQTLSTIARDAGRHGVEP